MNSIFTKISSFFRNLFALLRVTLTLQIGRAKVSKEHHNGVNEDHTNISGGK